MYRAEVLVVLIMSVFTGVAFGTTVVTVPGDIADIQSAIAAVPDGGIIEVAVDSYLVPLDGFLISNAGKSFTIRSANGGRATLDGGGSRPVLRFENVSQGAGQHVTFENLNFSNGLSTTGGRSGGVTVARASATFVGCRFIGNSSDADDTGGGGTFVHSGSFSVFIDCIWSGNTATNEGAGLRIDQSTGFLHRCVFESNRVNLPNHRDTAAGGGLHVTNATVRVTNTRFDQNQAGYAGGGFYVLGTWSEPLEVPAADAIVANCTFTENIAVRDPSVSFPNPTEGGGLHIEDHVTTRVFNSRFIKNAAENGGGLNLYRALVEVENSLFRGNRATKIGPSTGFGGAIAAISNDTWADGSTNRRSAHLIVRKSLLQGRFDEIGTTAQIGGCMAVIGDGNRRWGENGVSPAAGSLETRATTLVEESIFYECDVKETDGADGTGAGGAAQVVLTDLTIQNSLILKSDAIGDGTDPDWAAGGGIRNIIDSTSNIQDSTMAHNTATRFGGAIHSEGSNLDVSGCQFLNNDVGDVFGTHIFATPYQFRSLHQTGNIELTVFSNTTDLGPLIWEGDLDLGPINDNRYNANTLFSDSQGQTVYSHTFATVPDQAVAGLNSLVIHRSGAPNTEKSQVANFDPPTSPQVAAVLAAPAEIIEVTAAGDTENSTQSFVAFAWSGTTANLDGIPLMEEVGLQETSEGSHSLEVDGDVSTTVVANGSEPSISLVAVPMAITSGSSTTLHWLTSAGTFLDVRVDHDVQITPSASGSIDLSPTVTTTYRVILVTKEGGATAQATVFVDEMLDLIFADGFESGNTGAW